MHRRRDAYRRKALRQALYDAGEVIMADVIVNLHGDEHRSRRRLENRLFRRDRMEDYEKHRFPAVIEATITPHVEAGSCELVNLSHQLMMNLAATTAGIDRPLGTPEETFHLYDYLMTFIEGATLAHYTGDRDAKAAEVADEAGGVRRRVPHPVDPAPTGGHRGRGRGEIDDSEVPVDVLTTLLRNEDDLELPHETIRRETAFYLLAGAHTSATAFVRTLHRLFSWESEHPEESDVIRTDPVAVQRCMHETIRLEPSSPVAMRWALEDLDASRRHRGAQRRQGGDRPDVGQPRPRGVRRRCRRLQSPPSAARGDCARGDSASAPGCMPVSVRTSPAACRSRKVTTSTSTCTGSCRWPCSGC